MTPMRRRGGPAALAFEGKHAMPITLLDGVLVGFTLVSAILAMVRGLSREVLSIASWVIAALAGYFLYPLVAPYLAQYISNAQLVPYAAFAAVFVVVLIVATVITMKIADTIIDSRVGALDRTLGFLYGAARGVLVVAVGLLFFTWLVPTNQPGWIAGAKSRPLLQGIGQWIEAELPADPEETILRRLNPGSQSPAEHGPGDTTEPAAPQPVAPASPAVNPDDLPATNG
jgi:membrane protein required for colicin V production